MEKARIHFLGIMSTIIIVVFFVFIFDLIVMPLYTQQGQTRELPDITELSEHQADSILTQMGFRMIRDREQYDDLYPAGIVIAQNPLPFSQVKKGRRIYVTVSAGERFVEVPRLIGLGENTAMFSLREMNLDIGQVFYEYNNYYPNGVVSYQSVAEKEEVVEGTTVDMTISLGRLPTKFEVPDVVGKSLNLAEEMILKAGLKIGQLSYEVQPKLLPDTVIEQAIAPGTEVKRGETVNLILSRLEDIWE